MNNSETTPAPWRVDEVGFNDNTDHPVIEIDGPQGEYVLRMNGCYPKPGEYPGCGGDPLANAELIVNSRNAIDVWLRRRFHVFCVDGMFNIAHPECDQIPIASEDNPVDAILAAEKWYVENGR